MTLADRFWAKVTKTDGCWLWTGSRTQSGKGYGKLCSGGKQGPCVAVHRVSWELHHGAIPAGRQVLHHCDNKICVRPDHLFLGDPSANAVDLLLKGYCDSSKLRSADILRIRRLHDAGVSVGTIAEAFSITTAHVRKVGSRRAWTFVPEAQPEAAKASE